MSLKTVTLKVKVKLAILIQNISYLNHAQSQTILVRLCDGFAIHMQHTWDILNHIWRVYINLKCQGHIQPGQYFLTLENPSF